jgi:hypothetical protein
LTPRIADVDRCARSPDAVTDDVVFVLDGQAVFLDQDLTTNVAVKKTLPSVCWLRFQYEDILTEKNHSINATTSTAFVDWFVPDEKRLKSQTAGT